MKTALTFILSLGGLLLLSNCTTVEQPRPTTQPTTQTTVTEETSVSRPYSSSVETQTTRRY
jgi:outer membrane protein assembly factor BamE (lipoprotein component of BamABCDE complex)